MLQENRQLVTSRECNWNAAMLYGATYDDALAKFAAQLQFAGAQVRCFDLPGKGVLIVSWKRPQSNAN